MGGDATTGGPSVSPVRVKFWSYGDLLGLRTIAWLRATKTDEAGAAIPKTAMPMVRVALDALRGLDLGLWTDESTPNVGVDRGGRIVLEPDSAPRLVNGQEFIDAEVLEVLRPFAFDGHAGPDLVRPRPRVRIVPGKLAGAPHVKDTRIETEALAALLHRGLDEMSINRLYPILEREDVHDALISSGSCSPLSRSSDRRSGRAPVRSRPELSAADRGRSA